MKFIDEKGRIFGKISIFDLTLVLLIVFAVFAIGIKKEATSQTSGSDKTITYDVTIKNIRGVSVDAIYQNLESFTDSETGKALGEALNVKKENAKVKVHLEDGQFGFSEYENKFDVVVTLKTAGTETSDAYFTSSGKQIITGDTIKLQNGFVRFEGEVTKVTVE